MMMMWTQRQNAQKKRALRTSGLERMATLDGGGGIANGVDGNGATTALRPRAPAATHSMMSAVTATLVQQVGAAMPKAHVLSSTPTHSWVHQWLQLMQALGTPEMA